MISYLFLQLLFIFINAQQDKIHISPTQIYLDTSEEIDITLRLSSPIQCSDPHSLCDVVVLFTNPDPNKLSIRPCMAQWTMNDWDSTRTITIKALEEFTFSGETQMEVIIEPVISNAEFYRDIELDNIDIYIKSIPSARCSSTGDPHYTTFDGYHYHFYDRGEVLMVRSLSRDFEVQARTHGGPYSRNCAVAAKENNNLVIIDVCNGHLDVITDFVEDESLRPTVYRSGENQYIIDFLSGANVNVHIWGNNMNIYISVIGGDRGHTIGMCGTYDGNSNNEGNPSYIIRNYMGLPPEWRVNSDNSLWNWIRTEEEGQENELGHDSIECHYTRPLTRRPILRIPNIEDITDILKQASNQVDRDYIFVAEDNVEEPEHIISHEEAIHICESRILGSNEAQRCQRDYDLDLNIYFNNCVEDVLQMSNIIFADDSYQTMVSDCYNLILDNNENWVMTEDFQPSQEIVGDICVSICGINGMCINGSCVCYDGYAGEDCRVDINREAEVLSIYPMKCDLSIREECGRWISITGNNFLNSDNLMCLYSTYNNGYSHTWRLPGKYMGYSAMLCPVPLNQTENSQMINIWVSNSGYINNNGLLGQTLNYINHTYEEYIETKHDGKMFIWYDGVCIDCNNTCHFKDTACHIEKEGDEPLWMRVDCIEENHRYKNNECRRCIPSLSNEEYSYITDSDICRPLFSNMEYVKYIVEDSEIYETLLLDIVHPFVPLNLYNVTFDMNTELDNIYLDNITGLVEITGSFDYENKSDYYIDVYLYDRNNVNIDNTILRLVIIDINEPPKIRDYNYTIIFDRINNVIVGNNMSISIDDPDILSESYLRWNELSYTLSSDNPDNIMEHFSIDETRGYINIDNEINDNGTYVLLVDVVDGGGSGITITVYIKVIIISDYIETTPTEKVTTTERDIIFNDVVYNEITDSVITTSTTTEEPTTFEEIMIIENDLIVQQRSEVAESNIHVSTIVAIVLSVILVLLMAMTLYINKRSKKIMTPYDEINIKSNRNMISNPVYSSIDVSNNNLNISNNNLNKDITENKWYHEKITDSRAKDILLRRSQGSFIVTRNDDTSYKILLKHNNKIIVKHINFDVYNGYRFDNGVYFVDIPSMIEYYLETSHTPEFPFKIVKGDNIYDNIFLKNNKIINIVRRRYKQTGPPLPLKKVKFEMGGEETHL
tara:strand:+ start:27331 stop:30858 length:3528 start_codon:yes stop_codon:yes gene_type:complete